MKEAQFYQKLDNKSVACRLCRHFCVIKNGQTGLCRARKNENGILYSLVYGYPLEANIDPIEKKPLFHFFPGSATYSFGTLGCNFACANCQNWNISQARVLEKKIKELDPVTPERIVEEALGNDCLSISYTYNEPTVFTEYALDTMRLARANGLKNVWVTNGYMSEDCLKAIIPHLDAININLKAANEKFYREVCGGKLKPVLETCQELKAANVWLEIGTDLISGLAGQTENLKQIAYFIAEKLGPETPWHLSRLAQKKDVQNRPLKKISLKQVRQAYEIGKNAGLTYVYLDDIPRAKEKNTFCPRCKIENINRSGFRAHRLDKKGLCRECGFDLNIAG